MPSFPTPDAQQLAALDALAERLHTSFSAEPANSMAMACSSTGGADPTLYWNRRAASAHTQMIQFQMEQAAGPMVTALRMAMAESLAIPAHRIDLSLYAHTLPDQIVWSWKASIWSAQTDLPFAPSASGRTPSEAAAGFVREMDSILSLRPDHLAQRLG